MSAELIKTDTPNGADLTGRRFGRWTVVRWAGLSKSGRQPYWECRCECGGPKSLKNVYAGTLLNGSSTSCGCVMREANTTHGLSRGANRHPLYRKWIDLRRRCDNPEEINYPYYGGRGISYDSKWKDFALFLEDITPAWEEAKKLFPPGTSLTIDRIDTNGNYSKENVRFVSHYEQMNNTNRNLRFFSPKRNLTKTCAEWAEITGIPYITLIYRLKHWDVDLALEAPRNSTYAGKPLT